MAQNLLPKVARAPDWQSGSPISSANNTPNAVQIECSPIWRDDWSSVHAIALHFGARQLGHVVLGVTDFRASEAWYKERFGLVTSDEIQPAPGIAIGAFMRCDRGDVPCDHHTLFLMQRPGAPAGFMHAAYEVASLDDLMAGHDLLAAAGHVHHWGIGRHILGSQVFDYWLDPHGFELEHWTDGDQLRLADGGGVASVEQLMSVQWGMKIPPLPGPM